MKNIYKISFLVALCSFVFSACNSDDDTNSVVIESTVNFSSNSTQNSFLEGDSTMVNIMLSTELPFDVQVTIDATSSDGSIAELEYDNIIIIPSGETSASVNVIFNDDRLNDPPETYTISISNIRPIDGDFPDSTRILIGDYTYNFVVESNENGPTVLTTTRGDADIVLTWGSGSDMDLILYEGNQNTANQIDSSTSTSPMETVILPSGSVDGEYSVWVSKWPLFSGSEDITVTLTFPSVSPVIYTGTITDDGFFLLITKSTSGADVTYNIDKI